MMTSPGTIINNGSADIIYMLASTIDTKMPDNTKLNFGLGYYTLASRNRIQFQGTMSFRERTRNIFARKLSVA
jgi:hypothetical protein